MKSILEIQEFIGKTFDSDASCVLSLRLDTSMVQRFIHYGTRDGILSFRPGSINFTYKNTIQTLLILYADCTLVVFSGWHNEVVFDFLDLGSIEQIYTLSGYQGTKFRLLDEDKKLEYTMEYFS